ERRTQIRSSNVAHEQRVTGDHRGRPGRFGPGIVIDHQRNRFDRMARRLEHLDAHVLQRNHTAVTNWFEWLFRDGLPSEADRRADTIAQLEMAGDEIRMEVGQKDVRDAEMM